MSETKKIEKPWCICLALWTQKWVGKIVRESRKSVEVIHVEDQCYPPSTWDPNFIIRFATLQEAIDKLLENAVNRKKQEEIIKDNFPSAFKEDSV